MLELTSEILEHLKAGGTLLVPSRQRATAVRVAYSAAMLRADLPIWNSPDVLPWAGWLERELQDARARGEQLPRRLNPAEEWFLWQEAVHEACAGFGVLMPDSMIEPVRRAVGLLDDYGLTLQGVPTAEVAVLRQSILHFRRRREELHVLGRTSWREFAAWLRPSSQLMLAGFAAIGAEREKWLLEHGARVASAARQPVLSEVLEWHSAEQEADAVGDWCAAQLALNGSARLLVLVPDLASTRHLWERALSQRLDPALILAGGEASGESSFAIEGGRPLTSYRIVSSALSLIALAAGQAGFNELSEVLRSPYLSAFPRDTNLSIDRWLREHSVARADLPSMQAMLPVLKRELNEGAGEAAAALLAALEKPKRAATSMPSRWAQSWAALLQECGWPGAALGSDEQQVRMRFDELLGDFAAVALPARRLTLQEANARLQSMAQRVSFEPATEDVPVTVSARLEDPIVWYDGLWVAGLSSDVWPPPPRPDPLLPLPVQYAAGVFQASAEGQSQFARQVQQQWARSAGQFVLSWCRSTQDLPRDRSPLLGAELARQATSAQPRAAEASLEAWQAAQAPILESWSDDTTPAPTVAGVLRGGTRLLELQSLCPFRAFAEFRLQASPLPQPAPGISPQVRGMVLHQALELFWKAMSDQATLREASAAHVQQVIEQSVERAMRETLEREPGSATDQVKRREHARTAKLMTLLVEWELKRRPFRTMKLESQVRHEFSGAGLDMRLDRVDELDDGRLLLIDYKSGSPKTFDGLAERLRQPQLPAYAMAAGPASAAVATLYLGRERVKLRGSADSSRRLQYLQGPKPGEPTWDERMQRWQRQLQLLVDEFLRGDASVHPQPDACKWCHLHSLCRIDPATLAALDTDPDDPGDEESEEESEEETE